MSQVLKRRVSHRSVTCLLSLAFGFIATAAVGEAVSADVSASDAVCSRQVFFDIKQAAEPSSGLETRLFADALNARLEEFSPFEAALVASGATDADSLDQYKKKAAALADEFRGSAKQVSRSPRELAQALFEFMHGRVLRGGYHIGSSDLRSTLDDGRFNCVSATILFNYLAGELGLECRGVAVPGHVMSRVILPDGKLDLETTCPTWFQVLADPQKRAAARTRHADAAQAADHAKPQEVSPIQMAAMVYYNRGVDLLGVKKFSEAAVVNAKAVRLDPQNATARGNLLATLNNWSIELGGDGRFREAVEVLHQGLLLEPKYEAFAQNYVHVHRQWADSLCRTGHLGEAMEVLTEAVAEMPDQPYLRQVQGEVSQRLAQSILNQQNDPETPAAPAAATN